MNRLILNKATSSNDEPTPGYLYNEISQMTFCSKESVTLVGEYLLKKLQRTDLNVKLKTLKILKHLCDNKRYDFRNFLKKKIDIVKECQTCNIVNDELKGETPSILVRKEATDLIKLIYSYDNVELNVKNVSLNNQETMKSSRIEGFGNTVYDKKSYGDYNDTAVSNTKPNKNASNKYSNRSYNGNTMSGFGNPYFNQNPTQKTKGEIAIKYINEVANKYIPSSFVNKINKVSASISKKYSNGSLNIQNIMNVNGFNKNYEKNNIKKNGNYNNYYNHSNSKRIEKTKKPQESQISGIYETKIIDDVLNNTGIKIIPSESTLNEFARKCDTLDTKLIVSIITSKLKNKISDKEENYKYKLKVLSVIKHLLIYRKQKEKEKVIETLDCLIHNLKIKTLEELYRCKEIKQIKKQVVEIFVLMGLQKSVPSEEIKNEIRQNVKTINLLDIDDDVKVTDNIASVAVVATTNAIDYNKNIISSSHYDNSDNLINLSNISDGNANISKINNTCSNSPYLMDFNNNSNNNNNINNNNYNRNYENNENKNDSKNLIYNLDNFTTSNHINNNELFKSLNFKENYKTYTITNAATTTTTTTSATIANNNYNSDKLKGNNSITSRNELNFNLEGLNSTNVPKNSISTLNNNYSISFDNNLIFTDGNDYNNKTNESFSKNKNGEYDLNDAYSFFQFDSNYEKKRSDNNNNNNHNSNHNNNHCNNSSNGYLNKETKAAVMMNFGVNDTIETKPNHANVLDLSDLDHVNNTYDSNNNLDKLILEKYCLVNNNLDITKNNNNNPDIFDINKNPFHIKKKSFDNLSSYKEKHFNNLLNNENRLQSKSYETIPKTNNDESNKKSNYVNNTSDIFKKSLNNSIKIDDEHINNFLNSFSVSSKKSDECNTKGNVTIDAFELLADKLKL